MRAIMWYDPERCKAELSRDRRARAAGLGQGEIGSAGRLQDVRPATIALDTPVVYDAEALFYRGACLVDIIRLFGDLGFHRLAQRIPRWQSPS